MANRNRLCQPNSRSGEKEIALDSPPTQKTKGILAIHFPAAELPPNPKSCPKRVFPQSAFVIRNGTKKFRLEKPEAKWLFEKRVRSAGRRSRVDNGGLPTLFFLKEAAEENKCRCKEAKHKSAFFRFGGCRRDERRIDTKLFLLGHVHVKLPEA